MSVTRQIDEICDRFEAAWASDRPLNIAEFLTDIAPQHRSALMESLIGLDIDLRISAGIACTPDLYADLSSDASDVASRQLNAIQDSRARIAEAVLKDQPEEPSISRNVGPYKVLQSIGKGGMGQVFMAEQTEPIRRRVALKVINSETPTREILGRFEAERQALAMMNHQNIAKVLDAGITEDGQPYFAMELVKGVSITDYCDKNRLSPNERLELFAQTCHAIQHAHMKGIIHRDLKPSNILVTLVDGRAVAKVIDFGLAKALQDSTQLTDQTLFTQYGQIMGTLAYMSPEQAEMNALDVDTRTDVYSLGVILYELLAGSTPLTRDTIRNEAFDRVLALIREEDVSRPSHRLSESGEAVKGISDQRRMEPRRLGLILKGELDWIAIKALEKDRTRRYDTPAALAGDVERYLRGEAIEARPPSLTYRFRKALQRNKGAFTAAGISLLSLLTALVVTAVMWVQSDSDREKAEQAEIQAKLEGGKARIARDEAEASAEEAKRRKEEADDARKLAEANKVEADAARSNAEQERQVAEAVRLFLQNDILRQASVYEQSAAGVEQVYASLTVKQALVIAANKFTLGEVQRIFPEQPEVQSEILGTLAESLSVVNEHELAVRCSRDRISILEGNARQKNLTLPPALLSARMEHLFFLVNAKKNVEAAQQYAMNLSNLEAVLKLKREDFTDATVNFDNEIDLRTAAVADCLQMRLDPTRFSVDQWLSADPNLQQMFSILAAVVPTLGQPERICNLMKQRYPANDYRVLYARLTVATENHAGADIAGNSDAGGFALNALNQNVSYDTAIEIYKELIVAGEASIAAGKPLLQDGEMKLAGVRFMMSVAMSGQAYFEKRRNNKERSQQLFAEAAEDLQLVSAAYARRLGNGHPTLYMSDSFLMDCLDELGRFAEAITVQKRIVSLTKRCFGPYEIIDETENLADIYLHFAKAEQNKETLQQALTIYTELLTGLNDVNEGLSDEQLKKFRPRFQRKQKNCEQLLVEFNDTTQPQPKAEEETALP